LVCLAVRNLGARLSLNDESKSEETFRELFDLGVLDSEELEAELARLKKPKADGADDRSQRDRRG
jgi:hypothetical protein